MHRCVESTPSREQLISRIIAIEDALESGKPLVANQGQALDGYSALAAFREVARKLREEAREKGGYSES